MEAAKRRRLEEPAPLRIRGLNGNFGALVETELEASDILAKPSVARSLVQAWQDFGGLLVLRGLTSLSPEELVAVSGIFGELEPCLDDSKAKYQVKPGVPVMRIGNTRDEKGELTAMYAKDVPLPADGSPQYRPDVKKPVWHTDSVYRKVPPVGSTLFCRQAPPSGAATCFADARAVYEALNEGKKRQLQGLECVCSMAHHDAKVHKYAPDFPVLTEEMRAANPPVRVPVVLVHPLTGRPALYGVNSSTCAVVPKGASVDPERMDEYELQAVEDESVKVLRDLLPFATSAPFTVRWEWRVGDFVVWDNRCTMHCATGFDADLHTREMWRTTLAADAAAPEEA